MSSQRHCKEQPLEALEVNDSGFETALSEVERMVFGCSRAEFVRKLSTRDPTARAWNMIGQRYDDPTLTLGEASRSAGASQSALNREMQSACGLAFYQVLRRYRLVNAARLLIETDRPVLDIALAVGFGSVRALEKAFARLLSISPGGLRGAQACKGRGRKD